MAEASQQLSQDQWNPNEGAAWLSLGGTPDSSVRGDTPDFSSRGGADPVLRFEQPHALARAVQRDILPRLGAGRARDPAAPPAGILAGSIETFASLILARDLDRATSYLDRIRARGLAVETLCLELLAPTARHFGDRWTDDTLNFADVTIALGNLQRLLRDLNPPALMPADIRRAAGRRTTARSGLLVAGPGEQHTFGLAMVTAFFRRAGWVIWSGAPSSSADLLSIVRGNWFQMIGFSLAYEGKLDALRAAIRGVRQASRNPCIRIMVGGPVFIEHPEFVAQIGADAMAVDGQQAVMQAEALLTDLPACV